MGKRFLKADAVPVIGAFAVGENDALQGKVHCDFNRGVNIAAFHICARHTACKDVAGAVKNAVNLSVGENADITGFFIAHRGACFAVLNNPCQNGILRCCGH